MPDIDVMGYMPDPHEHIQIIPIVRDGGVWFQITDTETGQAFIINFLSALKMSGRLSYLTGRLLQDIGQYESDQLGPLEHEDITRAQDDPDDPNWMQTLFRRPKN